MATSGSFTTSYYKNLCMMISWSIKSQSVENNTTTLSWTLKGLRNDTAYGYITCGGFKVVIDGVTVYSKSEDYRVDVFNGTEIASGELTIAHGSDGSKSFSASAEAAIFYHSVNVSGSGTFTLDSIPRVSVPTLSESSVNFGSKITIYTNRQSSSFTHHLYYSVEGGDEVGITDNIGASYTWTVPYDLMSNIPSGTKATIMFRLYTFNGATNIGNNTISFTANAPNNSTTKPAVSMTLSPVSSLSSAFSGLYIQGKTKVKAVFSATGKYGASINSCSMTAEGVSYGSGDSYTSRFLSQYGSITVTGYATDSRNFTGNTSEAITVIAYSKPSISAQAYRCDASGNKSDSGTYLKISATRSYAKVMSGSTQKNFCLIRYRYKASGDASYSGWTTILAKDSLSSDAVTTGALLSGALSIASSYSVQVQAVDDIGENALTEIPIATETVHTHKAKNSIGLGKYSEKENTLDMGWNIELNGNKVLNNGVEAYAPAGFGLGVETPELISDCDNAVNNGWYQVTGAKNLPANFSDGWIFVSSFSSAYKRQEFYSELYGGVHAVRYMNKGAWSEFEWVNPPMVVGVEYRTTERWNGAVVYRKLIKWVNETALSGEALWNIPHGISNLDRSYGVEIVARTNGYQVPFFSADESTAVTGCSAANIELKTLGRTNWSASRTWYFDMKCVKSS